MLFLNKNANVYHAKAKSEMLFKVPNDNFLINDRYSRTYHNYYTYYYVRDDGQSIYNGAKETPQPFRFVSDDYFELIDLLNDLEYDENLILPITKDLFYNSLLSKNDTINAIALDYLVDGGYITESLKLKYLNSIHNLVTTIHNNTLNYTMDGTVFSLEVNEPIVLDQRFNHPSNKLYLVLTNYSIIGESGVSTSELKSVVGSRTYDERTNYQPVPFRKFYNPTINKMVNQISYFAFEISEIDGSGDIKFDRTDIIDVVDNFKISVELPQIIIGGE